MEKGGGKLGEVRGNGGRGSEKSVSKLWKVGGMLRNEDE